MCPESPEARERRLARGREWKRLHSAKHAASVAAYRQRHPEKRRAQNAVSYALRKGLLVKGPCAKCGTNEDICAHHEDYSKPLEVMWLCRSCHVRRHEPQLSRGPRRSNTAVAKLTEVSVRRIRNILATGLLTNREVAQLFEVTPENISSIRDGKSWRHIDDGLSIPRGRRGAPALLPEVVKKCRELAASGYTQAQISREVDISTASVSRILHGRKGS